MKIDLQPLVDLGLTMLEAEIYAYLLENSPLTGYGIAKGIGKPAANSYKALESLHNKGAIIIEDSKTRLCRAVPYDELLDSFERSFKNSKSLAQNALRKLKASPGDNRIYQLQTTDQVLSRFRKMLVRCQRVAMLDLFPFAVENLKKDIVSAVKRSVKVTVKIYEPCDIPGAEVIVAAKGKLIIKKWPGQWANGVIDGEQHLLAFLSRDGQNVIQAVWSNNFHLSWVYYGAIVEELKAGALEEGINSGLTHNELKKILKKYNKMLDLKATGYKHASTFFVDNKKSIKNNGRKS